MTDVEPDSKKRSKDYAGLSYDAKRDLYIGVVHYYDGNGDRKQKRVSSKKQSVALTKLNRARADLAAGKIATGVKQWRTVSDWLDYWLSDIVKPDVRPKTYDSYEGTVRLYIKPLIGKQNLDRLSPGHARTMIRTLREKGTGDTKASTRNAEKAYVVLTMALNRAVKDGRLPRNIMDAVDRPKHVKKARGAFELETAIHVLKTAAARDDENKPDRPKLASRWVAAFMTGARQAECLGLEWDRVDLDAGVMDIEWQLQRHKYKHGCGTRADGAYRCGRQRPGYCPEREWDFDPAFEYRPCHRSLVWTRPKSLAGSRYVPLTPLLLESLKVHRKLDTDPNPHGLVWHHRDGRPISQEDDNEQWNLLMAASGIDKHAGEAVLHEARNTAATMLLESGVDAKVIKEILGHASILQTRDYQRVSLELSKSAVANAFDRLLPKA